MPQPNTSLPFDMMSRVASCSARSSGLCNGNSTSPRLSRRLGALLHTRAVVDDKADMATLDAARFAVRHPRHVDELVPHVDKGAALAPAAQVEVEELAVPVERLVDVADLDRHMIDADQPGLLAVAHLHPPVLQDACRHLSPTAPSRASAAKTKPQREGHKGCARARRRSPHRVLCVSVASFALRL